MGIAVMMVVVVVVASSAGSVYSSIYIYYVHINRTANPLVGRCGVVVVGM
jgi:hypothetical protein